MRKSSDCYRGPASLGDCSHWPYFVSSSPVFKDGGLAVAGWTALLTNLATTIPVGDRGAFATQGEARAAAEVALAARLDTGVRG